MKTVMKKIVTAIASALMILLTVSCGSTSVGSNKLYGRWDAVGVNTDGAELTMDEVKAMGDDSMDNFYFIIKEGGKAYVHVQDEGELGDWEEIENGVKIGAMELVYEQEKLAVERNGIKVYFEKTSDDQTITGDNGNKTDDNKDSGSITEEDNDAPVENTDYADTSAEENAEENNLSGFSLNSSTDKHIQYINNYVGRNLASFGYTSIVGSRLDTIGAGTIQFVFVTPDGSYIDPEDEESLKGYTVL